MTQSSNNAQIVRRVFEECVNERKLELIDELFAPQFVDHGAPPERPPGRPGVHESYARMLRAFPDFTFTIHALHAEADRVEVQGSIHGTHRGQYNRFPATGKEATWSAHDTFRLENGLIVERWIEHDTMGMLKQVGALPG